MNRWLQFIKFPYLIQFSYWLKSHLMSEYIIHQTWARNLWSNMETAIKIHKHVYWMIHYGKQTWLNILICIVSRKSTLILCQWCVTNDAEEIHYSLSINFLFLSLWSELSAGMVASYFTRHWRCRMNMTDTEIHLLFIG